MKPSFLNNLTAPPPEWLQVEPADTEVVFSSRIRLARNLNGFNFPGRATADCRQTVRDIVLAAVDQLPGADDYHTVDLSQADQTTRLILSERHLMSREMLGGEAGTALSLSPQNRLAVQINEEDHIRLQGFRPGLDLQALWDDITPCDTLLCEHLPVAFDERLGFLTACPSNTGTGLRVSAMLWLPGLVLSGQAKKIIQGAEAIGLAIRGFFGEGTQALGHVFQISNQMTLGESEEEIITRLGRVAGHLALCEKAARQTFASRQEQALADLIGRAFGTLCYARRISCQEALGALFSLRLGVMMGFFTKGSIQTVNHLIMAIQPGHMSFAGADIRSVASRQQARADLIRQTLKKEF